MNDFKIFAGSSYPSLAEDIAKNVGVPLGKITLKKFSCGETYIRFEESFRGKDIFLIQTCRTGHMNEDLIELFLMINAARESFAENIHVVMPYFAYSRQDKIHDAREGISAKLFADLIVRSGAGHIITVQLHADQIQGFFGRPVDNLHPRRMFIDYFKKKELKEAVVVSPDAGGAKMAKKFADGLGVPLVIMHKQRPEHNISEITHLIGDVKGKTPIIVDDMIDTGGSVAGAYNALVGNGSKEEVYLCASHAIFSGEARKNLNAVNFAEIVCTDSLPVEHPPHNFKTLSMAPLFAEVIKNVVENKSVSGLYF